MDEHEREHALHTRREQMVASTREEVASILTLAGLRPERMWELANGYWPLAPSYDDVRYPWWLAQTTLGLIRIGSRKRVTSIDWDACKVRGIVTADDVTKGDTMVHAWSAAKAVEYLQRLREMASPELEERKAIVAWLRSDPENVDPIGGDNHVARTLADAIERGAHRKP